MLKSRLDSSVSVTHDTWCVGTLVWIMCNGGESRTSPLSSRVNDDSIQTLFSPPPPLAVACKPYDHSWGSFFTLLHIQITFDLMTHDAPGHVLSHDDGSCAQQFSISLGYEYATNDAFSSASDKRDTWNMTNHPARSHTLIIDSSAITCIERHTVLARSSTTIWLQ
jgi:hypothetical protein